MRVEINLGKKVSVRCHAMTTLSQCASASFLYERAVYKKGQASSSFKQRLHRAARRSLVPSKQAIEVPVRGRSPPLRPNTFLYASCRSPGAQRGAPDDSRANLPARAARQDAKTRACCAALGTTRTPREPRLRHRLVPTAQANTTATPSDLSPVFALVFFILIS